ncbi:hypothetical protein D0T57_10315 [Dysgonomonas sp. 511]|nr:hypothetical protein [Dysgonomonas sp. 511]
MLPVLYLSSCAKVDDDDNQAPEVTDIRININDTVRYLDGEVVRTIKLNDSLDTDPGRIDIVPIDKWLYVSAHFSDDISLSSYIVGGRITYKSLKEGRDSTLRFVKLGRGIFGAKDSTIIRHRVMRIEDTLNVGGVASYALREEKDHHIYIVAMDRAGNMNTSPDTLRIPVKYVRRKTIIEDNSTPATPDPEP